MSGEPIQFDRKLTPEQILKIRNVNVIGSGEPIVFIHGFGSSQKAWERQVENFKDTNQLILFDHAGAVPSNFSTFDPVRYNGI